MNPVLRDKCAARRIARAGCVDAIGIVRVTTRLEAARPLSNAERVHAWRNRSGRPGFAGAYVVPHQRKAIKSMPATSYEHRRLPLGGGGVAGALSNTGDC